MPLEELTEVPLRDCSLEIDLDGVKDLPQTLKAVTREERTRIRVCSLCVPLTLLARRPQKQVALVG